MSTAVSSLLPQFQREPFCLPGPIIRFEFFPFCTALLKPPRSIPPEFVQSQLLQESFCVDLRRKVCTYDSMPRGKSWLMATVALKYFLLSLHTSSLPRCGGLEAERKMLHLLHCVFYDLSRIFPMNESINHAHFPASAVMYSSQEIVFGAGAVRDCRLAGWTQDRTVGQLIPQSSHRSTHRTT